MNRPIDRDRLFDLLRAIAPFPAQTLVIGGCAQPIYAVEVDRSVAVVHTRDLDLAANLDREIEAFDEWTRRVAALPGYHHEPRGQGGSPATASSVLVPDDPSSPRIELLARPLEPSSRRLGRTPAPRWTGGLQPQRIDGTSLPFEAPWRVDIDPDTAIPVANPLAIILQKASLRRSGRNAVEKSKSDVVSIFEIARIFERHEARLSGLWSQIHGSRKRSAGKGLRRCREELLDERSTAVCEAVADLHGRGSPTSPPELVEALASFLRVCGAPEP